VGNKFESYFDLVFGFKHTKNLDRANVKIAHQKHNGCFPTQFTILYESCYLKSDRVCYFLDSRRTSGGVYSVNDEGYGSLWVESNQPLFIHPAFGVTVEPAGGSSGATGIKVLGGEF